MALPETSIKISDIRNTLGVSTNKVSELNTNAQVNGWSLFKPGDLGDAGSTFVFNADTPSYKVGDFRKYAHDSEEPTVTGPSAPTYIPGDSLTVTIVARPDETNIKEANISFDTYTLRFFSDAGRTALIQEEYYPISYNSISIPPGHSTSVADDPDSQQALTAVIASPQLYSTIYWDLWIGTFDGDQNIHFPTWQGDFVPTALQAPDADFQNLGSFPSVDGAGCGTSFTTGFVEWDTGSGYPNINAGDTTFDIQARIMAIGGCNPPGGNTSIPYPVSGEIKLTYVYNGTTYTLADNVIYDPDVSGYFFLNDVALAPGDSFAWGETKIIQVEYYSVSSA